MKRFDRTSIRSLFPRGGFARAATAYGGAQPRWSRDATNIFYVTVAKMAKIHWTPKPNQFFPDATVPGNLLNVDFMVKDSKRFADSGGWGYAVFDYDAASDTFKPGTEAGTPPQRNDAKCGFACHTTAKSRDYVFTEYGKR